MMWLKRVALWSTLTVGLGALGAEAGVASTRSQVPVSTTQDAGAASGQGDFVTRTLGDVTFHIPTGYIDPFSGYADRITLHALLPRLLPEDASNADQFHVLGWGRILRITLTLWDENQLTGQELLQTHLEDAIFAKTHNSHLRNSKVVSEVGKTGFIIVRGFLLDKDVFVLRNSTPPFLVSCSRHSDVPSPECEVRERYGRGLLLEYLCSRNFIDGDVAQTLIIDARVRKLSKSLTIAAGREDNIRLKDNK